MPFVQINRSLPRSLDVQISLSRASVETRTDLSILVVALENLGFFPDANRIRFYSNIESVENDFTPGSEAHFAATSFFAQTPHPPTMALGEVFLLPTAAENASSSLSDDDIIALKSVTDGVMNITYGNNTAPDTQELTAMDFSTVANIADVVAIISDKIGPNLNCVVRVLPGNIEVISITTKTSGDDVIILFPFDPDDFTFVGDLLKLTLDGGGRVVNGYTPLGIAEELTSIGNAANAAGKFIYGWTLGESLRTTDHQEAAAAWALPRIAMMVLVTNDILALEPAYMDDIGPILQATDNRRAVVLYHNNAQRYPDVSILAYMLHVDYRLQDSTVTAKFKQLPGIETVQLSETNWSTLQTKGYNSYTAIGNDSKTYRDGVTSGIVGWYMDTVINLDNFIEDLGVNVFNVFLRNKKIPYTRAGQLLLVDACQDTGDQYTYNGTFAAREKADNTVKSGFKLFPAVLVIPTPVNQSTAADRAARAGPPIQMIVQESGAIHSTSINVELVQ